VIIYGIIDFPTAVVNTLGMGYVCTYSNQDSTSAFNNAKTIDYISTNFPLAVQNLTWNVNTNMAMLKTGPLRTGYVGDIRFILNLDSTFQCTSFTQGNCGYIYINLHTTSSAGNAGGFGVPPSTIVCTIYNPVTLYKYGCQATYYANTGTFYGYKITTYENLPSGTNLEVTMTSLLGTQTS
jgi:hypothetical protein